MILPEDEHIFKHTWKWNAIEKDEMEDIWHGPRGSSLHSLNLRITVEYLILIWSGYLQLKKLLKYDQKDMSYLYANPLIKTTAKQKNKTKQKLQQNKWWNDWILAWVSNGLIYDGYDKKRYLENKQIVRHFRISLGFTMSLIYDRELLLLIQPWS